MLLHCLPDRQSISHQSAGERSSATACPILLIRAFRTHALQTLAKRARDSPPAALGQTYASATLTLGLVRCPRFDFTLRE